MQIRSEKFGDEIAARAVSKTCTVAQRISRTYISSNGEMKISLREIT